MNFKGVILKNLKSNVRYYLAYFLCICFSIAFFFMLVNLVNDNNLKTSLGQSKMFSTIVSIPLVVLGIFSIIFISYVNRTLIKQMSKELGLFLALGMERKRISTIVIVQNITIGTAATAFGLLLGTVFSKLFFIVVLKIMDISNIPFELHLKSYLYTTLLFFIIFLFLLLRSLFTARKLQVNELLKESRKKEDIGFKNPVWGILGIILMVSSFIIYNKYVHVESLSQTVSLLYIAGNFAGLSLLLSQFHNVSSFLSKRNKNLWYKNLMFNTNLRHRISSNKKFIFALTITYYVMFTFGTVLFHEYMRVETVAKEKNPYDFVYMNIRDNKTSKASLEEVINKNNASITKEDTLQLLEMSMNNKSLLFIADDNYNKIFNKDIKVSKGNAVILKYSDTDNNYKKNIQVKSIINYNEDFSKNALGSEYGFIVNNMQVLPEITNHPYRFMIEDIYILSKEDFNNISKEMNSKSSATMYLYKLKNWKDGYKLETSLKKTPENNFKVSSGKAEEMTISKAFSTLGDIKNMKSQHGLMFFLFSFICLIFFLSAGSLIYFKYFSEIDYERRNYKKLKGIGITNKEIKSMIGKDMLFIFFVPCIMGALISFIENYEFYPSYQRTDLITASLIVISLCIVFQIIYYLITRKKVYMEVIK